MTLCAAGSARADDVVDLGGETITYNNSTSFGQYVNKELQNGTINLTTAQQGSAGWTAGTYTIGSGAIVNCAKQAYFTGDWTINLKDGGEFNQTSEIFYLPFRYGNVEMNLADGGKFTSADNLWIGGLFNNRDSSKNTDNTTKFVMTGGSTLSVASGKNLKIGAAYQTTKATTVKNEIAVTNSFITLENGQIELGASSNNLVTDPVNSYTKITFGPGSVITLGQIYAHQYPTPSVAFDGATICRADYNYSSFIGHDAAIGDIYEILSGGLVIDVPDGKSLTCDGNSSSLKGVGGITKIGAGSITWNQVSSGGSTGMTFTGPLVVSNGTWSSSLSYAATAFAVDGASSTLTLSGALSAEDVVFAATGGGALTLSGATIADATPDLTLSSGGTTDFFTRDNAVATDSLGVLTLGPGATLSLTGGGLGVDALSVGSLVLSATTADKVSIVFTDAAGIASGSYNLITITGSGTFAAGDEAKFELHENAPEGASLSLSADGKSIQLTIPESNPATWTGAAGDGKFSSIGNWLGNAVPGASDDVVISVDSDTTLDCDVDLTVKSIVFPARSAKVTISGTGSITNAATIVNYSSSRHVIGVLVEFVADGAYAPIDVTGEVDFQGGVTGTVPVNHTTFYGNYMLTAAKWTLSSAITLAANATVTASDMQVSIGTQSAGSLCAESGASLDVKQISTTKAGDIFGTYSGDLKAKSILIDTGASNSSSFKFGENFSGTLTVGEIVNYPGTGNVYFFPRAKNIVFDGSNGASNSGLRSRRGTLGLGAIDSSSASETFILRSSADWTLQVENSNDYSFLIKLRAAHVGIDTSDFKGAESGHTVTFANNGKDHGSNGKAKLLEGDASSELALFGGGTVKFKHTANFTGGLTASNGVTLAVNKDVYPGKGNVMVKETATLSLNEAQNGTVPIAGTLTMEGGSTLNIPVLAPGVLPLSVNALEFDGDGTVALDIGSVPSEAGYYPILKSATALPEGAAAKFSAPGQTLVVQENTIFLQVGDTSAMSSGVWVGGVDENFSNRFNWKNFAVPEAGSDLDFSGLTQDATVNADIQDAVFGTIRLPSHFVYLQGSLHLATLTNALYLAVESGATLTIDGDAVLNNDGGSGNYRYMFRYNKGRIEIGGRFVNSANPSSGPLLYYSPDSTGTISAKGLTNTVAKVFSLCGNHSTPITWVVGEYGIARADGAWGFSQFDGKNGEITLKAGADFTASAPIAVKSSVKFDTTDESGDARTITSTGGLEGSRPVTIAGTGTFVADMEYRANNTCAVSVTDTATLAINPGKVVTTGAISVGAGAALEVAQSGTVAPGGDLTLADGAVLAFNYTSPSAPVLALDGKTVSFDDGETANVTVRISAADGTRARGGRNVLTTGGRFDGASVTLAEGAPFWVKGVDVEDGDIVLAVKPAGLSVILR